ncbi:MAG: hypothetical protein ACFFED_09010, partial [Candidatus Thorarchaeota archaeon]
YNSSTYTGLSQVEISTELLSWGLDGNATFNLQLALMRWHSGENKITKVNAVEQIMDEFNPTELDTISYIGLAGLESFAFAGKVITFFKNWNYLKELADPQFYDFMLDCLYKMAGGVMSKTSMTTYLFKNSKFIATLRFGDQLTDCVKSSKYAMSFKDFESALFIIGIIVEIGLGIAAGCMIADQIGGSAGREFGTAYGILAVIVGVWLAGVYALIGTIPFIGWLISLGCAIYDATTNFSQNMIVKWVQGLYGNICRLGQTIPNVFVENVPTISTYDVDDNGNDLGDFIVVNGTLWNEIDVAIKYIPTFWDMWDIENTFQFELVRLGLTSPDFFPENSEYLTWILPYVDIIAPEGSNSLTPQPYSTFQQYMWEMTQDYLLGRLDALDYRENYYIDSHRVKHYTYQREYAYNSWIIPGTAMADFPITTRVTAAYNLATWWWHCPVWYFGARCYHTDWFVDSTQFSVTTQYYDIFPSTLNDFLSWKEIKINDQDGDGLNATQEIALGTSPVDFDTDADGLDDKYETDHGYDPTWYDTDSDMVTDWYEHAYGTNVTDSDTDQDGLSDFEELSGWVINFKYLGNSSLPFQMVVTSDPKTNDSDRDGIDDLSEYQGNTNPRSNDTNGDGSPDSAYIWIKSEAVYETAIDITLQGEYNRLTDICVDAYGDVYVGHSGESYPSNATIKKFDSSLNPAILPVNSIFPNMTMYPSEAPYIMEVDRGNDYLYTYMSGIDRFNLSGTVINPDSWSTLNPMQVQDFDFDSEGNIYVLRHSTGNYANVQKYSSSGSLLATYGSLGSAQDQFDWPISLAVDDYYGFIYVCDNQYSYSKPDRVVKLRLSDGTFLGVVSGNYQDIMDVDVDDEGYIYVLGTNSSETTVQKFYPHGEEDVDFRFSGNSTHDFYASGGDWRHLAIGPDKSIYVVDWVVYGTPFTSRIWKFSQNIELTSDQIPDSNSDWDNDGLTNVQEIMGWEISVNFTSGELTFNVTSNPLMNDTDLDGLGDSLEYVLGSNPNSPDTDLDGIRDHQEWWASTYPDVPYVPPMFSPVMQPPSQHSSSMSMALTGPSLTNWDTDGDLLRDGIEYTFGSSPINPDMDGDGLSDLTEFLYNSNPNSTDTDLDGASDAEELAGNSSLLSPDSDSDLIFDGTEYDMGTNATDIDFDGDGIPDGYELLYVIDPKSADSDGDGVSDDIELSLYLDPRSNDTDKDGVPDGTELAIGSNPLNMDSDFDGIPDGEDPDTFAAWEGPIILVLNSDPSNETLEFADALAYYAEVIIISVDELLSDYSESQYVVLVGQPDPDSYSVEGLMYDLLEDTGAILDEMMEDESRSVTTRLGIWTETQTVVMLASALQEDSFMVLQILRGRNVTVLPDSIRLEYQMQYPETSGSIEYAIILNEVDITRNTDAIVTIYLSGASQPMITITRYNMTTTPYVLEASSGLGSDDISLNIYLDVSLEIYGMSADVFSGALIQIYYRESDLDLTQNGQLGDLGDINETSLSVYFYDEISEQWTKLSEELSWVLSIGQNTTNVEIYGNEYGGFVWIQVNELHLFALAGQVLRMELFDPWMTVMAFAIAGFAIVGSIVVFRRYRSRERSVKYDSLLNELID